MLLNHLLKIQEMRKFFLMLKFQKILILVQITFVPLTISLTMLSKEVTGSSKGDPCFCAPIKTIPDSLIG